MDNPNITMEEYIRLEKEEKVRQRGKVYNWETAKYVSSLNNNEIDFRISFDESDDEDHTVIFDKKSLSYKIIFVNDLKTVSENDNEKVDMPSFPSPEPKISCFDDLDFFKDFENEFPAIIYNDALTSKSDFLTEPTLSPQHIDEFDLKGETSLSEYDEVEQNILYFNDLFPFNIIYPDDLKSDNDNDDNKIDIRQSSGDNVNTQGSNKLLKASHDKINRIFIMESFVVELIVNIMAWNYINNGVLVNLIKNLYVLFGIPFDPKRYYKDDVYTRILRRPRYVFFTLFELGKLVSKNGYDVLDMAPLPPRDQRHLWLRYQVEGYAEEIVHDFEDRLETIFERHVNRVHVLYFKVLTLEMRQDLAERLRMVYTRDDGQDIFFILALGFHTVEEMAEDGFKSYWLGSERAILDKGDLSDYWIEISSDGDFLRVAPSYTYIRDPLRRLCHRLISYNIFGRGQAPKKHAEGRKSDARLLGGHFIRRLAHHFGMVNDDGLRGLSVVTHELPLIDMVELVKLNISMEVGDDWAWVAQGVERQPVAVAAALGSAEDAPDVDEGA
ncbi:hypothetical protein Tco_1417233 [Tanacetum coccineum]